MNIADISKSLINNARAGFGRPPNVIDDSVRIEAVRSRCQCWGTQGWQQVRDELQEELERLRDNLDNSDAINGEALVTDHKTRGEIRCLKSILEREEEDRAELEALLAAQGRGE